MTDRAENFDDRILRVVDILSQAMDEARQHQSYDKIIPMAGMAAELLERYRDSTHVHTRNANPGASDIFDDDDDDDDCDFP